MIDIKGKDKATLLAALYNNSIPRGLGMLHFEDKDMTVDEARDIIDSRDEMFKYDFDYLKGRVMKVNLSGDEFRGDLYDRDNGQGSAQRVVDSIT